MEPGVEEYFEGAARWLRAEKVHCEPGLSDNEVASIESRYKSWFPGVLRMLLQTVVPVSAPKAKRVWLHMQGMKPRRRWRVRAIAWSLPNWRKQDRELDDMVTKSFG